MAGGAVKAKRVRGREGRRGVRAQVRTPAKLRESVEQLFGVLFASNPEAIVITRLRDARILEVNAAWERNSGYRRAEVLGRSTVDMNFWVDAHDRQGAVGLLELRDSFSNIDRQFRRRDGRIIDTLMSAARVSVDGEACAIWSWRDVSDMRAAERRAQQSERKYAALFEVNPVPVMITHVRDGRMVVLEVNGAFV